MANSCHTANNVCNWCKNQNLNGIIRDCKFYCSDSCYSNSQKSVHFGGIEYRDAPDTISWRPSSSHSHSHHSRSHHSHSHHSHSHHSRSHHSHHSSKNNKQCNYCFVIFDRNDNPGIKYENMWFCSQNHLNLANPRPKIMMAPAFPLHIAPQVMPHLVAMGHRFVGGPFIGPF